MELPPDVRALIAGLQRELAELRAENAALKQEVADLDAARDWAMRFVAWYNNEHRHSGIGYVTPAQRHAGEDKALLAARHELYQQARASNPARWSRQTRNWTPSGAVTLNPERETADRAALAQTQLSCSIGAPAFPSRPGNSRPWSGTKGMGSAEPPGATRSAPLGASMARMASTGPSP